MCCPGVTSRGLAFYTLGWDFCLETDPDVWKFSLELKPASLPYFCGLRWALISCFLSRAPQCDPPLEVTDLFVDIQDGKILMALLEVLSGRNLVRMLQKDQEEPKHRGDPC